MKGRTRWRIYFREDEPKFRSLDPVRYSRLSADVQVAIGVSMRVGWYPRWSSQEVERAIERIDPLVIVNELDWPKWVLDPAMRESVEDLLQKML